MAAAMPSWACHEKPIERTQSKLFLHGDSSLILGPAVNASNTSRPGIDSVSEWLRRWTRNPLGSAREGSNPFAVVFVHCFAHTCASMICACPAYEACTHAEK